MLSLTKTKFIFYIDSKCLHQTQLLNHEAYYMSEKL